MGIERRPGITIAASTTITDHGKVSHRIAVGWGDRPNAAIIEHEEVRQSSDDDTPDMAMCAAGLMRKIDQLRDDVRSHFVKLGIKLPR